MAIITQFGMGGTPLICFQTLCSRAFHQVGGCKMFAGLHLVASTQWLQVIRGDLEWYKNLVIKRHSSKWLVPARCLWIFVYWPAWVLLFSLLTDYPPINIFSLTGRMLFWPSVIVWPLPPSLHPAFTCPICPSFGNKQPLSSSQSALEFDRMKM